MQHRQPRLGDILDDYCPRERRITNHAVVAMVGPDIKQTRCTTCDAEHEYKHAKVPSTRKKKDAPAALYKQVLTSAQPEAVRAAETEATASVEVPPPVAERTEPAPLSPEPAAAAAEAPNGVTPEPEADLQAGESSEEEGPVHRRLIRATLPRPEGPVQRPVPQFTVRQPGKFGGNARGGGRPQGGGMGPMTRPRPSASARGAFARNGSRDTFTVRSSGGPHHSMQRARPAHRPGGRPARHGKKSK